MTNKKSIPPLLYNKEYYRGDCGDYEIFNETCGKILSLRLEKALKLGDIREGMNVLDIGCGRGEVLLHCVVKGARGIGIDYSKDAIEICQSNLKNFPEIPQDAIEYRVMDCKDIQFSTETFDCILMLDIYEHLYDWELDIVLKKVKRILKPGGKLIIHTNPNATNLYFGYKYWTRHVNMIFSLFTKRKLSTKMEDLRTPSVLEMHINEQNYWKLKKRISKYFNRYKIILDVFVGKPLHWRKIVYRAVSVLYPLSLFPPLNFIFADSIWVVAEKK